MGHPGKSRHYFLKKGHLCFASLFSFFLPQMQCLHYGSHFPTLLWTELSPPTPMIHMSKFKPHMRLYLERGLFGGS